MQHPQQCASLLQADLIPQLSGVLMMQPLARTATNVAYGLATSGEAASEAFRVFMHKDGAAAAFHAPGDRSPLQRLKPAAAAPLTAAQVPAAQHSSPWPASAALHIGFQLLCHDAAGEPVSAWHDVPLHNPEDGSVNFICEIPKNSSAKMEVATVRMCRPRSLLPASVLLNKTRDQLG